MERAWCDLDERLQNESPLLHGGMGHRQSRFIDDALSEKKQVDIDVARTFPAHTKTPHRRLDAQGEMKQVDGRHPGLDRRDAIQKPRLVGDVYWLRIVEAGDRE